MSDPTPEQIAAACAAIRAGWSDSERQRRNAERSGPDRRAAAPVAVVYGDEGEIEIATIEEIQQQAAIAGADKVRRSAERMGISVVEYIDRRTAKAKRCRGCDRWLDWESKDLTPHARRSPGLSVICRSCNAKQWACETARRKGSA